MKRFFRVVTISLLSFALLFSFVARAADMDFTAFTEDDPVTKITVDSASEMHTTQLKNYAGAQRLYYNAGVIENEDFAFDFTLTPDAQYAASGSAESFVGLSNGLSDYYYSNNALGLVLYTTGSFRVKLFERYSAANYESTYHILSVGTSYYFDLNRAGTTATLNAYSDSARTTLLWSESLALHGAPEYDYIYSVLGGASAPGTTYVSFSVDDMSLDGVVPSSITVSTNQLTSDASSNFTFVGTVNFIGSDNVTTNGFQITPYTSNYTDNFSENVNYGVSANFTIIKNAVSDLSLVGGTVYKYRAFVSTNTASYYGQDRYFTYAAAPVVVTNEADSVDIGTNDVTLTGMVTDLSGGGNVTQRGFFIGESSGSYNQYVYHSGSWNGTGLYGFYSVHVTNLSENTTYYYQAVAVSPAGIGVGDELSFTTSGETGNLPEVTTGSAETNGTNQATFYGNINYSDTPLVSYGFYYGENQTGVSIGDYPNASQLWKIPNITSGLFSASTPHVLTSGRTYYYAAYAENAAGETIGDVESITIGAPVNENVVVTVDGAIVNGTSVTLFGTTNDYSLGVSSKVAVAWGISGSISGMQAYMVDKADIAIVDNTWHYTVNGLLPNQHYYYVAGLYAINAFGLPGFPQYAWHWSDTLGEFTTGAGAPGAAVGNPQVTTGAAENITSGGFVANMTLDDTGSSDVSTIGFVVWTSGSGTTLVNQSGNFSVGSYQFALSGYTTPDVIVYYYAYAVNELGLPGGIGATRWVQLQDGGSQGDSSDTPGGTTGDISAWLTSIMASYGLDNTLGHWLFLVLLELVNALAFGVFIVGAKETLLRVILGFVMAIVAIAIFAGFMFSGLLGLWPAITAIIGIALLFIGIIIKMVTGNGGAQI